MKCVVQYHHDISFEEPLVQWLLAGEILLELGYIFKRINGLRSSFDGIETVCKDVNKRGDKHLGDSLVRGVDGLLGHGNLEVLGALEDK